MNLYLKSLVSNFEPCVAWLKVHALHDRLCEVHWPYLDGTVGGKC